MAIDSKWQNFRKWYRFREHYPVENPRWSFLFASIYVGVQGLFVILNSLTTFWWYRDVVEMIERLPYAIIMAFVPLFSIIAGAVFFQSVKMQGEPRVRKYRTYYIKPEQKKYMKAIQYSSLVLFAINVVTIVIFISRGTV